jgi:hypothetical protein
MLTVVLSAICLALIFLGIAILKALSSISLILSEIRDTQRKEGFRTRHSLTHNLGEIAYLLDPYRRRERMERHKRDAEEGAKQVALFEEYAAASPERRKEIEQQRETIRQNHEEWEDEQRRQAERAEREYFDREYPPRHQ